MTRRCLFAHLTAVAAALASGPKSTRQTIKDRQGRTLGVIVEVRPGRFEARDRYGRLLGTYEARTDTTRDRYGRMLTKGNTLSALVMEAAEKQR